MTDSVTATSSKSGSSVGRKRSRRELEEFDVVDLTGSLDDIVEIEMRKAGTADRVAQSMINALDKIVNKVEAMSNDVKTLLAQTINV